jgi:hypothetical protein
VTITLSNSALLGELGELGALGDLSSFVIIYLIYAPNSYFLIPTLCPARRSRRARESSYAI